MSESPARTSTQIVNTANTSNPGPAPRSRRWTRPQAVAPGWGRWDRKWASPRNPLSA